MATFPTGVASLTNPVASDKMNTVPHAANHTAANNEIVAIETALQPAVAAGVQGGIPFFSAAGILAALAAGTAGQVLTTQGAAANPTWTSAASTNVKVISTTRDMTTATGNVSYTGIGFRPKAVVAFGVTATNGISVALFDNVVTQGGFYSYLNTTIKFGSGDNAVALYQSTTDAQVATVLTIDADGFTLSYTKYGAPTGTAYLYFLAIA